MDVSSRHCPHLQIIYGFDFSRAIRGLWSDNMVSKLACFFFILNQAQSYGHFGVNVLHFFRWYIESGNFCQCLYYVRLQEFIQSVAFNKGTTHRELSSYIVCDYIALTVYGLEIVDQHMEIGIQVAFSAECKITDASNDYMRAGEKLALAQQHVSGFKHLETRIRWIDPQVSKQAVFCRYGW